MNTNIISIMLILAITTQLAGCATSAVVKPYKIGDSLLTCGQIKQEIATAEGAFEQVEKDNSSATGVAGAAVVTTATIAAIALAPGLASLAMMGGGNASEARAAAAERKENMLKLAESKGCK